MPLTIHPWSGWVRERRYVHVVIFRVLIWQVFSAVAAAKAVIISKKLKLLRRNISSMDKRSLLLPGLVTLPWKPC